MDKDLLIRIAVTIGVLLVVYYLLTKLFSTSGFLFGAGAAGAEDTGKDVNNELNKNKQTPTLPISTIQSIANSIFKNGYFSDTLIESNDTDGMVANLKQMGNDNDVLQLIKAFGTHNRFAFGIPTTPEMDLFEFVKSNLSDNDLAAVAADWNAKNIKNQI